MRRLALARILVVSLFLWGAIMAGTTAQAQIIPGFGMGSSSSAEESTQSDLAQAIRDAADGGVNVIVIGKDGQIITATSPRPDSAPKASGQDAMGGASILMRVQSRVSKFRESLRGRLNTLPNSFTEVAYILRATSPDGRIMRYVEILGWSLLLFLGAMIVTRELYGKRFARRLVESRVKDAPQGYREKMPFLVFRFLMGIGGTLVTMLLAYITGALIFGPANDLSVQITITAIYVAFFAARAVSDIWRMILSPYLSQYRIPRFSDRDARRLYFWARILATYDITAQWFCLTRGQFPGRSGAESQPRKRRILPR
jgi:moderate conductance mechanosensitive channel